MSQPVFEALHLTKEFGEQLAYLSGFYARWDLARQSRLLDLLDLAPNAGIRGLSAGTVQKLAIVAALCHHPDLILLDEPVSHLDPVVRDRLLTYLLEIVWEDNATVVISSHVLHDVDRAGAVVPAAVRRVGRGAGCGAGRIAVRIADAPLASTAALLHGERPPGVVTGLRRTTRTGCRREWKTC